MKEAATKGKGKKGKKTRCVAYLYTKTYDLLAYKPIFGRMTAAQRAAMDNIEDAPVHLTPYIFFFFAVSLFFLIHLSISYLFILMS